MVGVNAQRALGERPRIHLLGIEPWGHLVGRLYQAELVAGFGGFVTAFKRQLAEFLDRFMGADGPPLQGLVAAGVTPPWHFNPRG